MYLQICGLHSYRDLGRLDLQGIERSTPPKTKQIQPLGSQETLGLSTTGARLSALCKQAILRLHQTNPRDQGELQVTRSLLLYLLFVVKHTLQLIQLLLLSSPAHSQKSNKCYHTVFQLQYTEMAATCIVRPPTDVTENEYCRPKILHSTTGWAERVQFQTATEERIAGTTYVGDTQSQRRYGLYTANSTPHARPTPTSRVCMPPFLTFTLVV